MAYSPKRQEPKAGSWERLVEMARAGYRNACADVRAEYQWQVHGKDAVADVEF